MTSKPDSVRLLLIGGSLRAGSVNSAVLATASALAPLGATATIYGGMARLPHFNPDDDREPLPPEVVELRRRLDASDAVLFSTPEYAGSLPGSFKNLLDWAVGGGIYDKPVGWINASAHGGAQGAHQTLRTVLTYTGSDVVEAACLQVAVPRAAVGDDGQIADAHTRDVIVRALTSLIERVAQRAAAARAPRPQG